MAFQKKEVDNKEITNYAVTRFFDLQSVKRRDMAREINLLLTACGLINRNVTKCVFYKQDH